MISTEHRLFNGVPISERFDKMLRYATASVEAMDAEEILSCDVTATVAGIVDEYRFAFPDLDQSRISTDVKPPAFVGPMAEFETHFYVPFTGEREILRTIPMSAPSDPPPGELVGNEIHIVSIDQSPNKDLILGEFNRALGKIRQFLLVLETQCKDRFETLGNQVRILLLARRQQLERAGLLSKSLGYQLRRRDNPGLIVAPVVQKKIWPAIPTSQPRPVPAEPVLEDAVYGEILNALASMSVAIERNPSTFEHLDEPTIRDIFLIALNAQFEGRATGETFNGKGKTDILIRVEDKNIFIAECKFWGGPQSLLDAIDQLFGYVMWRDSKAAVLVFSKRKNFTRSFEEAKRTLEAHPQFRESRPCNRETSARAWFVREDDEQRRIDLTMMMFKIQTSDSGAE